MSAPFQPYIHQLPTLTFTLGTTQASQEHDLKQLPKKLFQESEIANLIGFAIEAVLTPTFATAPTVIGHNNALANIKFFDGADMLFDGQGNDLRMFESMEQGWSIQGEAITQTSTNSRTWTRFLPVGPMGLAGSPTDYMIPCAELAEGGKLTFLPSVLTDVSADTTAGTLVVRTAAILAPSRNELRVGPKCQRLVLTNKGSGMTISDEALYSYIGMVKASYGAFAAADLTKITLRNSRRGRYVDNVDAPLLTRVFNSQMQPGLIGQIMGEPRDSNDVAPRIVNFASATALAAQASALQPVVWAPRNCRLSKLQVRNDVGDSLVFEYSGSQAANSGSLLFTRFLPHQGDSVARRVRKAATVLGLSTGTPMQKTLNKRPVKNSLQSAKYGVYHVKAA